MSDDIGAEVLSLIAEAFKKGVITTEEKAKIKEIIVEENPIAQEYMDEYRETRDQKRLISQFQKYLKDCESDDELTQKNKDLILQSQSPEDQMLVGIKKHRGKKQQAPKQKEEVFANLEECEEGLSPKIVFTKKK